MLEKTFAEAKTVKIVATLGPSCREREAILELTRAGADIFRVNLSHSSEDEVNAMVANVRAVEKIVGRPLAILADLAGPKIRIGQTIDGARLSAGDEVEILTRSGERSAYSLSLNFSSVLKNLKPGNGIYLGDGTIHLAVERKLAHGVLTRVISGGHLRSQMGFAAEGLTLKKFALSSKDLQDVALVTSLKVDAIAVSFVQTPRDIEAVRRLLPQNNRPLLIAKIETVPGVNNADKILKIADGLMVARGDLGLSMPIAELPHIQKKLIALGLRNAKPVITATQMLESMIAHPMPTRAEVTDVANAILDGTDAVMLSGETAVGKFPAEAVAMMTKIIASTTPHVVPRFFDNEASIADAVSSSTVAIANQTGAKLVIVFTESGTTARRISRHRNPQPIVALSPNPQTIRQLSFSWGVSAQQISSTKDFDDLVGSAQRIARKNPVRPLNHGEVFVVSAGVPFGKVGSTNLALVERA